MKKEKLSINAKRRLERPPNDDALVAQYINALGWVGDRDSHHYSTSSNKRWQEAQLPQRDSASAMRVFLGSLK